MFLIVAAILFALGALGGLYMAALAFQGKPLPVAKPRAGGRRTHPFAPILPSLPAISREMLARCLAMTIRLITANRPAICGVAMT